MSTTIYANGCVMYLQNESSGAQGVEEADPAARARARARDLLQRPRRRGRRGALRQVQPTQELSTC